MARQTTIKCDVCDKPCRQIVGKLFYGPVVKGSAKAYHSNYTHHLDVGDCCSLSSGKNRYLKLLKWRPRMTARQYAESRRNGS